MLHILDYTIKARMPIPKRKELLTLATGFMCLTGSRMENLIVLDDETGIEIPLVKMKPITSGHK